MPVSYQLYAVRKFPSKKNFKTQMQLTLNFGGEHSRETSSTQVDMQLAAVRGYKHYNAKHDFLFRLDHAGRAMGVSFREFIAPYEFSVYRGSHDDALGFVPLFVRTKKKVASDFVERLNGSAHGFNAASVSLDFAKLREKIEVIRGAWFGVQQRPNITTASVFGHHVDQSDEFKHAEGIGRLTSLQVDVPLTDGSHTIMFNSECGIVLYNSYRDESAELDVLRGVIDNLLRYCVAPPRTGENAPPPSRQPRRPGRVPGL